MPAISNKQSLTLNLPSDCEIRLERWFAAPRPLVFEVFTRPEHIVRWWGCDQSHLSTCEVDLRPGGAYRYVLNMEDGLQHPFKGTYREVTPPERLVNTQIYDVEPYSQFEALITTNFLEQDGGTLLVQTIIHATREARDGHLHSGMEHGAAQTFDRLDAVLKQLP